MKRANAFIILLLMTCLASCSLFSPVPPTAENKYILNIPGHPAHKKKHRDISLLVMPVSSDPIYNTTQMAYSTSAFQIAYFGKNSWAENPGTMLQKLFTQTLENSHSFHAVISTMGLGSYQYSLNTQLLELKQVFIGNVSEVRLKVRAQIINASTNQVVASKEFSCVENAPQRTPLGGVVAANRAATKIANQIALFCINKL